MELRTKLSLAVLVVLVHAIVLGWFERTLSAPQSAAPLVSPAITASVIPYERIEPISAVAASPVAPEPAAEALPSDARPSGTPEAVETTDPSYGFNSRSYLTADQLDSSARPVIDWVIARQALPSVGGVSLVFRVWISADGTIDHFEVANRDNVPEWMDRALSPLAQTAMEPAMRNGAPVASTMMVEILIDSTYLLP